MSTITTADELNRLRPLGAIHDTLNLIYKTVKSLSKELPSEIMFIAFPRGAGEKYVGAHAAIGADWVAVDDGVTAEWAVESLQLMIDTVCEGASSLGLSRALRVCRISPPSGTALRSKYRKRIPIIPLDLFKHHRYGLDLIFWAQNFQSVHFSIDRRHQNRQVDEATYVSMKMALSRI